MSYSERLREGVFLPIESDRPLRPMFSFTPPPPELPKDPLIARIASLMPPKPGVENRYGFISENVHEVSWNGVRHSPPIYRTTYSISLDGQLTCLYGSCLSPTIDGIAGLMLDPVYGDQVCGLVAQHWPHTWGLMRKGTVEEFTSQGIFQVHTDHDYWFHGIVYRMILDEPDLGEVDAQGEFVIREVAGFPDDLPGLAQVMSARLTVQNPGAPREDRFSRNVERANQILEPIGTGVRILREVVDFFNSF